MPLPFQVQKFWIMLQIKLVHLSLHMIKHLGNMFFFPIPSNLFMNITKDNMVDMFIKTLKFNIHIFGVLYSKQLSLGQLWCDVYLFLVGPTHVNKHK